MAVIVWTMAGLVYNELAIEPVQGWLLFDLSQARLSQGDYRVNRLFCDCKEVLEMKVQFYSYFLNL